WAHAVPAAPLGEVLPVGVVGPQGRWGPRSGDVALRISESLAQLQHSSRCKHTLYPTTPHGHAERFAGWQSCDDLRLSRHRRLPIADSPYVHILGTQGFEF